MTESTSPTAPWGVSADDLELLVLRGRSSGSLTMDEVVLVLQRVELTTEVIEGPTQSGLQNLGDLVYDAHGEAPSSRTQLLHTTHSGIRTSLLFCVKLRPTRLFSVYSVQFRRSLDQSLLLIVVGMSLLLNSTRLG
jgi:hypothetical protein